MAEISNRWNPWAALRSREHLVLRWADLAPARGMIAPDPTGRRRTVWLHYRLGRRWRQATLAHELVHDERGIFYTAETPPRLIAKEENAVRAETARRLVPAEELESIARRAAAEDPVELWQLADWFDVPEEVAALAVERFNQGLD